jgi:hypothetical protein
MITSSCFVLTVRENKKLEVPEAGWACLFVCFMFIFSVSVPHIFITMQFNNHVFSTKFTIKAYKYFFFCSFEITSLSYILRSCEVCYSCILRTLSRLHVGQCRKGWGW